VSTAKGVGVLVDPNNAAGTESVLRNAESAARTMGLQILVVNVTSSHKIDAAFATFMREQIDALFVGPAGFFSGRRVHVASQAMRHGIPAAYAQRELPKVGGLMSYGTNLADTWRQVGVYAGRVLRGAKPADLPVLQSSLRLGQPFVIENRQGPAREALPFAASPSRCPFTTHPPIWPQRTNVWQARCWQQRSR
jgi:putative ABC transport system substrate-binding protein